MLESMGSLACDTSVTDNAPGLAAPVAPPRIAIAVPARIRKRDGTIVATARPAHMGATTQVWDATVRRKHDDKTIALFRCTQMLLPPR